MHYFALGGSKGAGHQHDGALFKIKDELHRNRGWLFLVPNYALYGDLSNRVMMTLEEMVPAVELYSIDEAFVDVSGIASCMPLETFGRQIRKQVLKTQG